MKKQTNSKEFLKFAENFYYSANFSSPELSYFNYSPVPYYLYCHSIELKLKSIILKNTGESLKIVKRLNHDLIKCYEEVKKIITLGLTKKEVKILSLANGYYNDKGFEYFTPKLNHKNTTLLFELWNISDLKKLTYKILKK